MWLLMWMALALGASEIPYDGVDQDADGFDLVDVDGDGVASQLAFGLDCNDRDRRVHPGAIDVPGDGVDANCDGLDGVVERGAARSDQADIRFALFTPMVAISTLVAVLIGPPRPDQGTSIQANRRSASAIDTAVMIPSATKPCQAHSLSRP